MEAMEKLKAGMLHYGYPICMV